MMQCPGIVQMVQYEAKNINHFNTILKITLR